MIHSLKYAKMMEAAGFSREQAETSIRILVEIMENRLATRHDILDIRRELGDIRKDFVDLRAELGRFEASMATKAELEKGLLRLKHDLTLKMGAMLSAAVALATALHKFM